MKKIATVLMLTLALNFIALIGGVGWLARSGHLDKDKVKQIKAILFPPPATAPSPESASDAAATTQPTLRLDELLAKMAGRTAIEQVDTIQQTFDAQMLLLDRRQRELTDLQEQVDLANHKLAADRAAFEAEKKALADREDASARLAADKGFQDSLSLYTAMPPKQVKNIFMSLDEATVENYLDAMEPRAAAKIIREFKTPDETAFIQRILERMRLATADGKSP
ncbi:MAG: hypothetical protein ABSF29_12685 [Tepidisphaeraceae bacterium]|jgi:hypothetical protein